MDLCERSPFYPEININKARMCAKFQVIEFNFVNVTTIDPFVREVPNEAGTRSQIFCGKYRVLYKNLQKFICTSV